ncbi:MAG: hypothetical protein LBV49_04670 [Azonexus sp.]|jgi:hypothetical protein|nr:hypothetical protein [Azonexus sp.]
MMQAESLGNILDFWHKVEFFIPFDLKQVSDQADEKDLKRLTLNDLRPQAPSPWRIAVPEGHELTGFQLYLGVFDMQAIEDFANQLSAKGVANPMEDAERTALDGQSCIAKISLNAHGEPEFGRLSVSTVPWAIGTAKRKGLAALTLDAFKGAQKDIADRLFNYNAARLKGRPGEQGAASPMPLTGEEITALHQLLKDWCGCTLPPASYAALLQVETRKKKNNAKRPDTAQAQAQEQAKDQAGEETDDDEEAEAAADKPTVEILNSFFIEDIERCMESIRTGTGTGTGASASAVPATLQAYLAAGDASRRTDLYGDAGRDAIVRALHPAKTNSGHWPDEPSQKMSLMQQFAINTAFERLESEGLFSVNGPPGTGKTTLLREMICENVTRRARKLAQLAHASDGLATASRQIHFGGESATVRELSPALTGFEMVVASSNNAAVENISTDLLKRKRLGQIWRDSVKYLQPVAHKVAAQSGEMKIKTLDPLEVPWGLISCALGKKANGRRFVDRFYFDHRPKEGRGGAGDPCSIRDWREQYIGPSFEAAKEKFVTADEALRSAIGERLRYAEHHAQWAGVSEQQFVRPAAEAVATRKRTLDDASAKRGACADALESANRALAALREEERLLSLAKPGLLERGLRLQRARQHAADLAHNAREQIEARKRVAQCRVKDETAAKVLREAQVQLDLANTPLNEARTTWREEQKKLEDDRKRFPGLTLPGHSSQIETDDIQKNGYWQDAGLAALRTRVFVAALALHEAWLAQAMQNGFSGNLFAVSRLLSGARLDNPADAKLIWQSLFMVVPVVSTTFASFARQFRGMGPGSIGWLFIDEAGQAVPQAAVGALWRARRAMVVGDPLQIEPVFTVPARLINALAELSPQTADGRYSPHQVSVQRLADEANPFGTYVPVAGSKRLWIGSPLRVHRRCAEPMFSIANRIAYQDKMVFGLTSRAPPEDKLQLGVSAWVDVRGKTSEKQVVPAQLEIVEKLILRLHAKFHAQSGELPPLYVISPFKAVKNALARRLKNIVWPDAAQQPKTWHQWCRDRIGTVHTFQGKEESIGIFVLGADPDGKGSAEWAASKPNLLNVALTRAQHRVYIVGDVSLWGGLKYFSEARSRLETITGEQWLGRIDGGKAEGKDGGRGAAAR